MKHRGPLISDTTVDAMVGVLLVAATPLYLLWRGWRYLRTGG